MGVDELDWHATRPWIVTFRGSHFDSLSNVLVAHCAFLVLLVEVCKQRCGWVGRVLSNVAVQPSNCLHAAIVFVPIHFVIYAHPFPSILLVVQLEGGTLCMHDLPISSVVVNAIQSTCFAVRAKERHIFHFEWLCLRSPRAFPFV